jgi:hypothetical protein
MDIPTLTPRLVPGPLNAVVLALVTVAASLPLQLMDRFATLEEDVWEPFLDDAV